MAREVDLMSMMVLKESAKNDLESADLFVADARPVYQYDDSGKRTDKVAGTRVTLQVDRQLGNPLSSKQFEVRTDQIFNADDIIDKSASVKIDDATVWASSRRNSAFAETHVSLKGHITLEEQNGAN